MPTLWFCLVAVMLAGYVILDGFDIGAGIIHLFVAKNDAERRAVLASIGPVWDGNEVWLLAAGGTLYFAFPGLYASSFSGFYLALMIVLWLLILRGISIEFRSHVNSELWHTFWDVIFAGASVLLAIFYGTALGNVVRGVPIEADGYFFLALWTNLQPGPDAGIIDWYTVLIGVTALVALTIHGALWVALKTEGDLQARCHVIARRFWFIMLPLVLLVSVTSFRIQPLLLGSFEEHPWGVIFPAAIRRWFSCRSILPQAPTGVRGVPLQLYVYSRVAVLGCDGPLSEFAAVQRGRGAQPDGSKRLRDQLRIANRIVLVCPGFRFGAGLFGLRVSALCRKGWRAVPWSLGPCPLQTETAQSID